MIKQFVLSMTGVGLIGIEKQTMKHRVQDFQLRKATFEMKTFTMLHEFSRTARAMQHASNAAKGLGEVFVKGMEMIHHLKKGKRMFGKKEKVFVPNFTQGGPSVDANPGQEGQGIMEYLIRQGKRTSVILIATSMFCSCGPTNEERAAINKARLYSDSVKNEAFIQRNMITSSPY